LRLACCRPCHRTYASGVRLRSGTVRFEQSETDPLADVTVSISVTGLTLGQHGFHVHQFGDVRSTADLSTMSAHFVPYCFDDCSNDTVRRHEPNSPRCCHPAPCPAHAISCHPALCTPCHSQVHGFPPSERRQPGDMGNVTAGPGRLAEARTIGQGKMSLTDPLRSM
jgi:Cu/Zn superoxide dismutase